MKKKFRVIINDDCASHRKFDLGLFDLWGKSGVNTYNLCVGADVLWYDTKAGSSYKDAFILQ